MNMLSLEDCVRSVLTNSKEEVWKVPSRLAYKLVKYGYTSNENLIKASNIYFSLTPIPFMIKKGKKDRTLSRGNVRTYDYFLHELTKITNRLIVLKSVTPTSKNQDLTPNPQEQTQPLAPICMTPSVLDYVSLDRVKALGGKTNQRINMDNLEYVFAMVCQYGRNKGKFFLSMNGHGVDPRIFKRNLERLEKLGLIRCVNKGRQYNVKNIISGLTNLASEYELLFTLAPRMAYKDSRVDRGTEQHSIDSRPLVGLKNSIPEEE